MSSLASALHICYKEKKYKWLVKNNDNKDLSTMIRNAKKAMWSNDNENKDFVAYKTMVALEHLRWCAYMLTEGWKCPSKKEFFEYAYKDGNDHRNKKSKLHPCLCPGNIINPFQLSQNPKLWEENDDVSELDRFSVNNYKLLCDLCKTEERKKIIEEHIDDIKHYPIKGQDVLKKEYLDALDKLCRPNAYWGTNKLYEKALYKLKESIGFAKKENTDFYKELNNKNYEEVLQTVSIFKSRNLKTDYSAIDTELVDMMPFCLWYGDKYETVITISNGLLYEDVIVPTLLAAKNVYIFIPTQSIDSGKYEATLKRYFDDEYTNINVRAVNMNNKTKLKNAIDPVLDTCEKNKIIINISKNANSAATIYLGNQAEKSGIDIIQYEHYKGVFDLKNGNSFYTEFAKRKLIIDDAIQLTNGEIKDKNDKDELQSREVYEKILNPLIDEKNFTFNTDLWSALTVFFQKHNGDYDVSYDIDKDAKRNFKYSANEYIKGLESNKIINITDKNKWTYRIANPSYDGIFAKKGTAFEGYLYYKLYDCGIFDDIKMGVNMYWDFGMPISNTVENEIDIVLTLGMKMFFVSCKSGKELDSSNINNWLYEIYSVSKRFNAVPVMAVFTDTNDNFVKRAKNMGISILDTKTILNEDALRDALTKVSKGEVFTVEKSENK